MLTILLTEDDADQRALYGDVLREAGYDIVEASSGRDALAKFKAQKPDLIVLDIQMPEMDGIEVLTEILKKDRQIPLILHSAYPAYKANFLTWGADAFVVKSGAPSELADAVRRVCEEHGIPVPTAAKKP
ncbi:MAG TPA: response regulator [Planctomycetota bacterium]|nr:response regulator [Planctomycetota bacterium]